ncbi:MAG: alpha-amylase family glycosyl hydrolase [Chlorobiaceae bacterium]
MEQKQVEFHFITGLKRAIFRNARLYGSWDNQGRYSDNWTESSMSEEVGEDGCPMFKASALLDFADQDRAFKWGVILDGPQGSNFWGIPTEVQDVNSCERYRQFRLNDGGESGLVERYYFTYIRRLGANKCFTAGRAKPGLLFAVWAPNAQQVDVVFGNPSTGYIADDGKGIDSDQPIVALSRQVDGIWEGGPKGVYENFMSAPYMYRILNAQGKTVYRSDIFSRGQIGRGSTDPAGEAWSGPVDILDGTVSCSMVIDPDVVRRGFESTLVGEEPDLIPAEEFWAMEFTPGLPVPNRIEDLVIYELHIGSLGFGKPDPGDLSDALSFLDHLVDLGVTAVELLPMAEFKGDKGWGYGDSHHFCIEASAGGRDKYRHFVRACHQRGIAVIQDVVYNHYDLNAERAEWQYDSTAPEQNIYYWYEGLPLDYPCADGGYLQNGSSGYSPRFREELVRQQFISSAAFLIEEMHVDGLRLDLTQAIHSDNRLKADGRSVVSANVFGQKLLRELSRTLRMIRPTLMLIAEDHTGWDAVTKVPAQGGMGFDATWDVSFYHSLIGDSEMAGDQARLLKQTGSGGNEPLQMDRFSSTLYTSQFNRVVYNESHDEAGNAPGTARTIVIAVNYAPLVDVTRMWAEARTRTCFGLSLLSAGTPMFFMGEEIGAYRYYTYDGFMNNREDIQGEREGNGKALFRFYKELITLRRRLRSLRSHNVDILHQSNFNRIIAFKRWDGHEQVIIVASLNNAPFTDGYLIEKDLQGIPDASWKEVFNSDAAVYGGQNTGNCGAVISSNQGRLNLVVPACGFVVLVKQ